MNIKNLLLKTRKWLRRIVTALRDTQSVYVNDNDDDNLGSIKGEASLNTKRSSLIDSLMLRMEEFITDHYNVRYNRLSQQYELSMKDTGQWRRLDDELCCRLLMEMNREGIAIAKADGKYKGRKPIEVSDFGQYYEDYMSRRTTKGQLAKKLHISRPTLNKLIDEYEKKQIC